MAFNHYARIKRILADHPGWSIRRIDAPTKAKNFNNQTVLFDHYYRIYDRHDQPIKYCKFQQIDHLASVLNLSVEDLPIVTER